MHLQAIIGQNSCFFYEPERKEKAREKVTECFEKTLSLLPVNYKRIKIPYQERELPGFFLSPNKNVDNPCVILINGLDSAKEVELLAFAKQFITRGLSVLIFDGPGQGLLLNKSPMPIDFENVVLACMEYMQNNHIVSTDRIGIFGVSFGGYLALRCGSVLSDKIKACINLSGGFDIANFDQINTRIQQDFTYVFQQYNNHDMSALSQQLTLKDLPAPICPTLCIHGGFDKIFPKESFEKIVIWSEGRAELALN